VCRAELADMKSQELGIGPVCRKRYLRDPDIEVGPKGWENALGIMLAKEIPTNIIEGVLNRKPDTRKAANLVAFWASAHYTNKSIVLACSDVLRHLGFTSMADRLESDRADLRFITEGARIEIFCKRHNGFNSGLRRMGAEMERHPSGRFRCWSVPLSHKPGLIILAGLHFANQLCFADGGIFKVDPTTNDDWNKYIRAHQPKPQPLAPGQLPKGCTVSEQNGRVFSDTPYNAGFVSAIRAIRGRRYHGGKSNSFPLGKKADVIALINQHFGGQP
jgi:hypothetical protein